MNRTTRTMAVAALAFGLISTGTAGPATAAMPQDDLVRCGPVVTPIYGCEVWRSASWDGGGGTSRDEPGDSYPNNATVSAVSADGRLVYTAGLATGAGNSGLELVTLAHETSGGGLVWAAREAGNAAYPRIAARALSVSAEAVFVTGVLSTEGAQEFAAAAIAYDPMTGEQRWRWEDPVVPYDAAVSPDGTTLYVAGTVVGEDEEGFLETSGSLIALDASTGEELWRSSDAGGIAGRIVGTRVAVSPDGDTVTMAGNDVDGGGVTRTIRVLSYETREDEALGIHPGDRRSVGVFDYGAPGVATSGLRYAPDGSRVYVSGSRRTGEAASSPRQYVTAAFRVADGAQVWASFFDGGIADNQAAHPTFGSPLAVSPGGSRVYVTGYIFDASPAPTHYFGTVAYDASTGQKVWEQMLVSGFVNCLFCLPNLAVNPATGVVHVTGTSNHRLNPQALTASYRPDTGDVDWVALVEDGATGSNTPVVSADGRRLFIPAWQAISGNQRDLLVFAYDARG